MYCKPEKSVKERFPPTSAFSYPKARVLVLLPIHHPRLGRFFESLTCQDRAWDPGTDLWVEENQ